MFLKDQVALITGATRGIGQAILKEFAQHGATIIGTATSAAGAASISAQLSALGANGCGMCMDVCAATQVEESLALIEKKYGAVQVLVNNAGITSDNLTLRMKDAEWDAVLDTNLKAVFRLSRGVMRGMMKARAGRIINITSVVAHAGNAGQSNYCAAKAGVAGMTRSMARELGGRNITVNCVAPGFIETDMTRSLDEQQRAKLVANVALGRFGQPEDVAAAVVFLASPGAAYVSGTTIHVNGGMYMD